MMKRIVGVLFFELLLVCCATQDAETRAHCNEDVSLECQGVDFTRMNFISVTWYKISDYKKHGIVRQNKDQEKLEFYNFTRPTIVGEKHDLILKNVMSTDSGIYECGVSANVGSKNINHRVNLSVSGCVTMPVPTTTTTTTMQNSVTITQCNHDDLPVLWSVTGYLAVGVTKIILSLFIIWVIRRIGIRSRRHKRTR